MDIVDCGKEGDACARGLRNPPSTSQKAILAALHTAAHEVEEDRTDLYRSIKSRRVRERTQQRIWFTGSAGNCVARGPGNECGARRPTKEGASCASALFRQE